MLDFRTETFLAVCRTLNYTQAARELSITQPAVSQHIAHLERAYDVALFVREGRRIALTPAGEMLRDALRSMAHDERLLRERMAQASCRDGRRAHVSMGMSLTAGEYIVAAPLARLLARSPNLSVDVRAGDTEQLLAQLAEGTMDCAFVEGIFDTRAFAGDRFDTQRLLCVCAPDHPLAGTRQPLEALLGQRLVVRERGSGSRAVLENALEARNLSLAGFTRTDEASSVGIIKQLVRGGVGVSFLYEAAVAEELASGLLGLIELEGPQIEHDITFVRLRGGTFERELLRLLRELRRELRAPIAAPGPDGPHCPGSRTRTEHTFGTDIG